MEAICERASIEPPSDELPEVGRIGRLRDEKWWRRQMHRHYSRRAEKTMREIGLVNKQRGTLLLGLHAKATARTTHRASAIC